MDRPFSLRPASVLRLKGQVSRRAVRSAFGVAAGAAGLIATPVFADQFEVVRNLSVSSMVLEADPLVKTVMGILLLASLATWTILVAKSIELSSAKGRLRRDVEILDTAASLQAARKVTYSASIAMVELGAKEIQRFGVPRTAAAVEAVKERVAARLTVVETSAVQNILTGVNVLASIGATAPFVGLAGTVWGIMNSFIGISKAHATNLAVVAPGIAEALLATAMGLLAAIPAVLIYNILARSIAGYRRLIGEVAVLTACVVSHELEGKADGPAEVRPVARTLA